MPPTRKRVGGTRLCDSLHNLANVLGRKEDVPKRCRRRSVPQSPLHGDEVPRLREPSRGEGVPQGVHSHALRKGAPDELANPLGREVPVIGAGEDEARRAREEGLSEGMSERHDARLRALAVDDKGPSDEIGNEIARVYTGDLPASEAELCA